MDYSEEIIRSIHGFQLVIIDDSGILKLIIYLTPSFLLSPEITNLDLNFLKYEESVELSANKELPLNKVIDVMIRRLITEVYKNKNLPDFENRHEHNKDKCIKLFKERFLGYGLS